MKTKMTAILVEEDGKVSVQTFPLLPNERAPHTIAQSPDGPGFDEIIKYKYVIPHKYKPVPMTIDLKNAKIMIYERVVDGG